MKKLNQNGFGLLEAIIVFVVVGLIAGAGYYAYNRSQTNSKKTSSSQNIDTRPVADTEPQKITYSERVIFGGSKNVEARKLGDRIKSFYELVLKEQDRIKPCQNEENHQPNDVCKVLKPYLTTKAIEQVKEPRDYALLQCGQMKNLLYSIDEPVISGITAVVRIRYLQFGQSLQDVTTGSLALVNNNGVWQIDNISCDL